MRYNPLRSLETNAEADLVLLQDINLLKCPMLHEGKRMDEVLSLNVAELYTAHFIFCLVGD